MNHLGFIVAAYGLTIVIGAYFSIGATLRLRQARRRLAAIDPRGAQRGGRENAR